MEQRMALSCTSSRVLKAAACAAPLLAALAFAADARKAADEPASLPIPLVVPEGFEIELVAGPPLVEHPIAASFDDRGRLYVAESSGEKLPTAEMARRQSHVIKVLEDTDGDGKFDRAHVFADRLTFPEGVLWHDGAVYTASPPYVWKFEDTRDAGVADRRVEWQKGFQLGHCANEGHGPYAGPDGRIYWGKGGFTEHRLRGAGGKELRGKASHFFRCRADGSEVEVVMSGGMDNPVGAAFTPEGELIFSCTFYTSPRQGLRDALVHAVEGGAYPKVNRVLDGVKRTGELLPALAHLGVAAVAGITAYQSGAFGDAYTGNIFSAQFNMHKVGRHILHRTGATFESHNEDFVLSPSGDFHPTDVLEDADGSLLVVNTGGWYMICCPTSQIAKPQVLGGIYRVRRKGAARPDDPRGLNLPWDTMPPAALAGLLDDPRFAVRNRAVHLLGKRGAEGVEAAARVLKEGRTTLARRNAVWALTRIDGDAARAAVRSVLADRDSSVRQTAVYSAGLHRDADARSALVGMLGSLPPPIRREAATALGRIGHPAAVGALLAALRPDDDRMLEHALIYALIEIADRPALTRALASDNAVVRRAALIALDQADDGSLRPATVTPLLKDADPRVQAAALEALEHHRAWARDVLGVVRDWFDRGGRAGGAAEDTRRLLAAYSHEASVQAFIVDSLRSEKTPAEARRMLLEVMAQAPLRVWPVAWRNELARRLADPDEGVVRQAAATVRAVPDAGSPICAVPLLVLAGDDKRPTDLRAAALAAVAPRVSQLAEPLFAFLLRCLDGAQPPLLRATAADAVAQVRLSDEQLLRLSRAVAAAGALELPRLLAAFEKSGSAAVGKQLVAALDRAAAARGLRAEVLTRALEKYPAEVRQAARPLFARLAEDLGKQKARLDELSAALSGGDAQRGRQVFLGPKATCAACHCVAGQGGQVGPDLTKIGATRSERDLLEAVVFPSASFVRGYEPYVIHTRSGQSHSGVIRRETADAIVLATGVATEVRILRSAVEEIEPGKVSVMPEGLDRQLSARELADLIAYLRTLK
jgi:putative membrane-bound dehydrogenase-like protein